MLFVLKRPILSCLLAPSRVARTRQSRRHLPSRVARTRQTRQHSPNHLPSTPQTRRHSPNAIFEKNVTRLTTFARVIHHSREFGASGHCLIFPPKKFNGNIAYCLRIMLKALTH